MATKRKAPAKRSVSAGRAPKRFEDLTVKDIVNRRVQSVRPDLTGDKVASVLLKAGVRCRSWTGRNSCWAW